jgi:hypothetical protein
MAKVSDAALAGNRYTISVYDAPKTSILAQTDDTALVGKCSVETDDTAMIQQWYNNAFSYEQWNTAYSEGYNYGHYKGIVDGVLLAVIISLLCTVIYFLIRLEKQKKVKP